MHRAITRQFGPYATKTHGCGTFYVPQPAFLASAAREIYPSRSHSSNPHSMRASSAPLRQVIVTYVPQLRILVRTSKQRIQTLTHAHPAAEKQRRRPKNESAANHFGDRCRFYLVQTHLGVYADFSWQQACPSTPRQAGRACCTCAPDTPGRARRATWRPNRRASSS